MQIKLKTFYQFIQIGEKNQDATSIWPESSVVAQPPQGLEGFHKGANIFQKGNN